MSLRQTLSGTGVALVTPFRSNMEVNLDALGRIIDFVIDGGVEYVVTLGTTGETPTLSKEEKIAIIQYTYEKVGNRVPVVVGVGGNDTTQPREGAGTSATRKSHCHSQRRSLLQQTFAGRHLPALQDAGSSFSQTDPPVQCSGPNRKEYERRYHHPPRQ